MILIALGANLDSPAGPPAASFKAALAALAEDGTVEVTACSRIYRSPAWPDPRDPEFRNAVAEVRTNLSPQDLLLRLHGVEERFGRRRGKANAPRPLDLDLLDCDGMLIDQDGLVLPHPRLDRRAFVLLPLQDIAPSWRHPRSGLGVLELMAALPRSLKDGVVPV
ncbi:MAG: 2-amino-4-hydroxy-6-hydroxymethyldihydropteridine diphosphokinase [Rhodospirillales bacterium]